PSSACTSCERRSKSMWSLARIPGNCLVMPSSSRTAGASGCMIGDCTALTKPGADSTPAPASRSPTRSISALRRRRLDRDALDLPACQLLLEGLLLGHDRLRYLGRHRADGHAAGTHRERGVPEAVEVPVDDVLDRPEDAGVDALHGTREHVRPEV